MRHNQRLVEEEKQSIGHSSFAESMNDQEYHHNPTFQLIPQGSLA
jgi:hypothetical protein